MLSAVFDTSYALSRNVWVVMRRLFVPVSAQSVWPPRVAHLCNVWNRAACLNHQDTKREVLVYRDGVDRPSSMHRDICAIQSPAKIELALLRQPRSIFSIAKSSSIAPKTYLWW